MNDNQNFENWIYSAVDPKSPELMGSAPPMLTALMYWVCDKDVPKFERACEYLQTAFEAGEGVDFQARTKAWTTACFGEEITNDKTERNHRFLEEALELVQSLNCTQSEAHQLVDYVFGRPIGEPSQEVGGVMNTLAALCSANGLHMREDGDTELARVSTPEMMEKIRAKQKAKPKHSPLPQ